MSEARPFFIPLARLQIAKSCCQSAIDKMKLGSFYQPFAAVAMPCGKEADQEQSFEQAQIAIHRRARMSECLRNGTMIEELSIAAFEESQKPGYVTSVPDLCDVAYVAFDDGLDVASSPAVGSLGISLDGFRVAAGHQQAGQFGGSWSSGLLYLWFQISAQKFLKKLSW